MIQREVTIRNAAGIHCRPAGVILNAVKGFPKTKLFITSPDGETQELNSILSLISLGLCRHQRATLAADGPEAEEAIKKIGDLFEFEFDFPMNR